MNTLASLFRYFAFGLQIDSEIELPELGNPRELAGEPDLTIRLGEVARFGADGGGDFDSTHWIDPAHFWMHVAGIAFFRVTNGREIVIMFEADGDLAQARTFLLGSVSGAMLVQRGFLVLHGNAIRIGDGCMVCVGDSGAGKSTLAAGFMLRGYEILADDVVVIDGMGRAVAGFPRIKLWQDAADRLGYSTAGMQRVLPDMDKYNLPVADFQPGQRLPVHWIYQLTMGDAAEVRIERIAGMSRFRFLRDNTYRSEYIDGQAMETEHLRQCSALAKSAHMARVERPADGFALDLLIDGLLADANSLNCDPRQNG